MIAKANSSLSNKTGAWRSSRPVVDKNKCVGCGICIKFCPDSAIDFKAVEAKNKANINYDYCKGCGLCAKECPFKAISMEKEK